MGAHTGTRQKCCLFFRTEKESRVCCGGQDQEFDHYREMPNNFGMKEIWRSIHGARPGQQQRVKMGKQAAAEGCMGPISSCNDMLVF